MKRLILLGTVLSVISGSAGVVLGVLGFQFPQTAEADFCLDADPWCARCLGWGAPCLPGQVRCQKYDGWIPSTGECCNALIEDWGPCHYPN